jgi:hypothetical protein
MKEHDLRRCSNIIPSPTRIANTGILSYTWCTGDLWLIIGALGFLEKVTAIRSNEGPRFCLFPFSFFAKRGKGDGFTGIGCLAHWNCK